MQRTRKTRPRTLRKIVQQTVKETATVRPELFDHSYAIPKAGQLTQYAEEFLKLAKENEAQVEANVTVKEEPQHLPTQPANQDGRQYASDNVKIKHEPIRNVEQLFGNVQENTKQRSQVLKEEPFEQTENQSGISEFSYEQVKVEMDAFSVLCHRELNYMEIKHKLSFRFYGDYCSYYINIINSLENVTRKSLMYATQGDRIQLELRNPDLKECVSVILSDENDLSSLSVLLDRLGQTNTFVNDLEIVVHIVQVPNGGTGVKRPLEDTSEWIQKIQRYLYQVNNPDSQLSFATSLAHCLYPDANNHRAAAIGAKIQKHVELGRQAQVTFEDITKFEKHLNRKIVVFYRVANSTTLSKFMTAFWSTSKPLYLHLYQNYYYGIKNLSGFLGGTYFCDHCYQSYKNPKCPICSNHCPLCLDPDCVESENRVYCKDCCRICRSNYCFEAHKRPTLRPIPINLSECEMHKRDITVDNATQMGNAQMVEFKFCLMCGEIEKLDKTRHRCYIQPLPCTENHNETNLIFYEFKTFVDESGKSVPFVLSTKSIQGKTWSSYGELCIIDFLLHFRSTSFSDSVFVAHDIDSSIILNAMLEMGVTPNVSTQTGQIVCFEDPDYRLKFIDSGSFLPVSLAEFPETFGFSSLKTFFPVCFASKANLEYVGPCPPPEFYEVEKMNKNKRLEFASAYQLAQMCDFDFKREAMVFCEEDTHVLAMACLNFRRCFINCYDVDPFSCATLASFGMKVFRTKFLAQNTLAISHKDDYKQNMTRPSPASIEWLQWSMFSEKIFIQHALNKGGVYVCNIYVDGYSNVNEQKLWIFISCLENGCRLCCPTLKLFKKRQQLCHEKLMKLGSLQGVKLAIMREHTWSETKKSNQDVQEFMKTYTPPQPLSPREAMYGDPKCAVKLRHTAASDEKIQLVQINSLHPYVMMDNYYPLGHPELIFDKFDNFPDYFGFIKIVAYPPRELYFPVLPYKNTKGEVVFTLCRSCADSINQQGACVHSDEERAITGVWVSPEIKKALKMGYRFGKILEVWHFPQKSKNIFDDYVKSLVKGKQESMGYPPEAKDSKTQEMYVREFQASQGILLDKDRIELNPAKTHAFDSCLENLWLSFGDRSPQINTEIVTQHADLVKYLFSKEYNVKYFTVLSDKTALVQWTPSETKKQFPKKTDNIFVTAFTAAYARLFFYSVLEKLEEKVLYYDTDTIFYVAKNCETELDFGNYLGQLTDKLAGDSIEEFATVGPKSYAYKTRNNQVVLNVKGIRKTLKKCEKMNLNSVKEMVEGYIAYRDRNVAETIKPEHKVVYATRQLLPNGQTLPFGY